MTNEIDEYTVNPVEYGDMTVQIPPEIFGEISEIYASVVQGAVYLKTKKQFSRFMNGAKRLGYGKIATFYRECAGNTFVLDYDNGKFEICPEIAAVLGEDEPVQILNWNDNSGAVMATRSFFDKKLSENK